VIDNKCEVAALDYLNAVTASGFDTKFPEYAAEEGNVRFWA
jgi:hypothetical protein